MNPEGLGGRAREETNRTIEPRESASEKFVFHLETMIFRGRGGKEERVSSIG